MNAAQQLEAELAQRGLWSGAFLAGGSSGRGRANRLLNLDSMQMTLLWAVLSLVSPPHGTELRTTPWRSGVMLRRLILPSNLADSHSTGG